MTLRSRTGIRVADFADAVLAPGLVDIHVHGGAGHDVMEPDDAGRGRFERFLTSRGVTSYCPTTVTAPLDLTLAALERLADAVEGGGEDSRGERAVPCGMHLEGPFISPVRRGVHPPANLLAPTVELFERFWQAARGHVRLITIAPELPGALEVIAEAVRRGVCVSLGHSDADLATTRRAVELGARHATHTFNAMRPLDHRQPGILGEVLTDPRMTADIIADGIHLDPAIVDLFLKAKGPEGAVLITDAIAATGMPEGRYRLGVFEVTVQNGKCTYEGKLAGSVLTMDRALRNAMQFSGWNLQQGLRTATANPARVAGLDGRGRLQAGCRADFVVMSGDGEVQKTVVAGRGI